MNKLKYAGICAGLCLLASCAKEDDLQADYDHPVDMFLPAPDAGDETSVLRREFFEKTGCYLLFNDTLQHNFLGYDYNDNPVYFTELLNPSYTIGNSTAGTIDYSFNYITDIDKQRAAVAYLEQNILLHLSGILKPFSWFLADRITAVDGQGRASNPYCVSGQRAIIVSCYLIPTLNTEAKRTQFNTNVMQVIMSKIVADRQSEFTDFYAVSSAYYSGTFSYTNDADNTATLRDKGFLSRGTNLIGISANGYYPTAESDLREFSRQMVSYSEEQLEQRYGQFPLVMEKFAILRQTMINMGYKF